MTTNTNPFLPVSGRFRAFHATAKGLGLFWLLVISLVGTARADLVAFWHFDETSGVTASDSVGSFPGTLTATGAAFVPGGISGNALQVSRANNGHVNMGPVLGLTGTDFSLVAWIKTSPGYTAPNSLIIDRQVPGIENEYFMQVNGDFYGHNGLLGKATFYASDIFQSPTSTPSVNDNQWHQIVTVYHRTGTNAVYVDGVPTLSGFASKPIISSSANFLIGGADPFGGVPQGFDGLVDEVQVYNHALSNPEITYLFENPGETIPAVIISPTGAFTNLSSIFYFTNSVSVALVNDIGAGEIRYTLDGTTPTSTSARYTNSLTFTNGVTVNAGAFLNGFPISDVYSATFARVYVMPNDGIPDVWRLQYFGANFLTDPRAGADTDPDGDGATNLQEYIGGTDPLNAASGFRITVRTVPAVSWVSVSDTVYQVLRRDFANTGNWTVVGQVAATNGTTLFYDTTLTRTNGYYGIGLAR